VDCSGTQEKIKVYVRLMARENQALTAILTAHAISIGHGHGVPELTPAGFCALLSDMDPGADLGSFFYFGSSKSLCGHSVKKTRPMGKIRLHRWKPESEQQSDSQI